MLVTAGGNWYPPLTSQVQSGVTYGVGGISLTGTLASGTTPTIHIVGIVDHANGTYTVTFSANVPWSGTGSTGDMVNIPALGGFFVGLTATNQFSLNSLEFDDGTGIGGARAFTVTQPPGWATNPADVEFCRPFPFP